MGVGQVTLASQLLEHGAQGSHLGLRKLGQQAIFEPLPQHI